MPLTIATLRQVGRCPSCSIRRGWGGTQRQHRSSSPACCDRCDGQGSGQGWSLSGGNCAVVSPRSHTHHLCSERPHLPPLLLHYAVRIMCMTTRHVPRVPRMRSNSHQEVLDSAEPPCDIHINTGSLCIHQCMCNILSAHIRVPHLPFQTRVEAQKKGYTATPTR